MYYITETV